MIGIIGAGPAGCFAAAKLAKAGKEVVIFEEHSDIGRPVQCTGIVTGSIDQLIKVKDSYIVNKVNHVRINSPCGGHLELDFKKPDIILDRQKFDSQLADMAMDSGAKIRLESRFTGLDGNDILVFDKKKRKTKRYSFSQLIGADGPMSEVARSAGMFGKRQFWHGVQARVKVKNDNSVEFFPFIGSFAWLVPEDRNTARIGVLARKDVKTHFTSLLRKFKGRIIDYQGGLVPIYDPGQKTHQDNIYLVGDAACQVKATTGGGIIPSLMAAEELSKSITSGKDYEKAWKKKIGRELWLSLRIRRALDKFSMKDYDRLVALCSKGGIIKALEDIDRDHPSRLLFRMALSEPRLLSFAPKFL